ncbi:GAF sensor-containing diguanylate cyclase/phosphodiesterase [Nitzschia inconspicua]|uniref:GAF sensor-containing diguanylate cyclase/phosphodiesterase n=1 Tax=Nitzschia inconspicua TaxID=303405 RepID=A0A9K3LIR0_9STRA|nr:GAF sensor-containing diguanylate cyclase/phosphodiesterase [Nitzschia inconspicua]
MIEQATQLVSSLERCENGVVTDKEWFGEYGLVGAAQRDESHLDGRFRQKEDYNKEEGGKEAILHKVDCDSNGDEIEDAAELALRGRIRFPKKIYGREKELEKLMRLFKGMVEQAPIHRDENDASNDTEESSRSFNFGTHVTKTVFVSGFSGSGKSALIDQFVDYVQKSATQKTGSQSYDQVLFLKAKYEKTQSSAPFSAFSSLFDHIPLSFSEQFRRVHSSLQDSLGDDVDVLRRIFPQLTKLFQKSTPPLSNHPDQSLVSSQKNLGHHRIVQRKQSRVVHKSRLNFAVSALFRALCDHLDNRPLILFVDDLQWADQSGLELLQTLVSDETLQYLFFIGAYRSNEIGDNPYFEKMVLAIDGKVAYETFHIGEICLKATGEFLSDSLDLPVDTLEPLSQAVFAKSLGNPLHIRQAVEHLVRRNVLYYDNMIFSWAWNLKVDANSGRSTTHGLEDLLADDILEMVKYKIEQMPNQDIKQVLAVASMVRTSFDVNTLLDVMRSTNTGREQEASWNTITEGNNNACQEKRKLVEILDSAVEEGLLFRLLLSNDQGDDGVSNLTYTFSHDRVQEAAASFLPKRGSEREQLLTKVGMGLLCRAKSDSGEDWMYFAAVGLLNSVATSPQNRKEDLILELAKLNAETAQLSLCLLAFNDAVEYVNKGLSLLSEVDGDLWETQYDLVVDLHCIGAQAELGAGNPISADSHCKAVISRKKDTLSVISAFKVHLDILGGEGDHDGALKLIVSILEELGVKFPKSKRGKKLKAWATLQQIKAGHIPTKEKIQNMPFVTDLKAAVIMELIQKAVRFAIAIQPELYILLCCEGIRWLNKYGITETSGASTASFANVVTHKFGDFKTGIKLAELAIFIVNRQNNKFNETQALNTANQNVLSWVRPIKSRLPYHIRAYESGVTSGNIEGACVGKWHTFWNLYHSAAPLAILEEDMRIMIKRVTKWGFSFFQSLYSMLLQLVQNLMGKSENSTVFIGDAMNETEEMWHKVPQKTVLATFKSYALVVFGEFGDAALDALERGNSYTETMPGMQYGIEPFYRGISLYAMARKNGDKKYKTAARQVRKLYKSWVKKGCVNLVGLLKLLDAEDLTLCGKKNMACKKYDDAIATLVRGGFYNNAGVACERYGTHLDEIGDKTGLREKLEQAKMYYSRWGAKRKVEQLTQKLENLHCLYQI